MRELGEPIMDRFTRMPTDAISHIHMDPEQPVPGVGHSKLIRELPDEALEAFFGQVGPDAGSPLLLAEFVQLGGALGRPVTDGGALTHLDAEYLMFAHRRRDDARRWPPPRRAASTGSMMRCLPGPPTAPSSTSLTAPPTWSRSSTRRRPRGSASVKREWDPDGLIRANHAPAPG